MSNQKKDGIRVQWSTDHEDLTVQFDRERSKANPRYVLDLFPKEVTDELEKRGYDPKTLKFEILKK